MVKVQIKKLNSKVKLPKYKTDGSSGVDLHAFLDKGDISINPNSSGYSIEVDLNDGDQIVFGYKLTSDTSYQQTPPKSTSECGPGLINPQLIQTISECTANTAVSTVEIRNLSDQVKTFYLEYKLNDGPWTNYDTVTINASSPITRPLNVTQNSTVQWESS